MPSLVQLIKMFFSALFGIRRYRKAMGTIRSASSKVGTINAILAAYKQGDYESALRTANDLESNDPAYHYFHGAMSMQLGRFAEAEKYLRRSTAMPQPEKLAAVAWASLGQLLLETQKYDEAVKCFETSLRYNPGRGSTYRDLAETALRRGSTAEALKLAHTAVDKDRVPAGPTEAQTPNLAEDLATLAWAMAATSTDRTEIEHVINEAISLAATFEITSSRAKIHVHCGKAFAALGDSARAQEHFAAAAKIDPHGLSGRAGKQRQ